MNDLSTCAVGDKVSFRTYAPGGVDGRLLDRFVEREVAMVIEAPRGRAVLFKQDIGSTIGVYGASSSQAEAVRAFMEQHHEVIL